MPVSTHFYDFVELIIKSHTNPYETCEPAPPVVRAQFICCTSVMSNVVQAPEKQVKSDCEVKFWVETCLNEKNSQAIH